MTTAHRFSAMLPRALSRGAAIATLAGMFAAAAHADTPDTRRTATGDASCHADAGWDDPAPPRRLYGNTWYVGTCGISAVLITGSHGDVVIDGGTDKGAALVEANLRRLGVRLRDVRVILNSHAHLDHAGGIAELQRDTGARVVARESGAHALAQGHGDRDDPQFASAKPFAPVANVHAIGDGETLTLGDIAITAHATPGHTPGSTSWTWETCEGTHCLHVAYADSLSAISDDDYRYGDDAAHPGVAAAFRASIDRVAALPCDILITPHPDASDLWQRVGPSSSRPLVDTGACGRYAERARSNFEKRLAKERGDAK